MRQTRLSLLATLALVVGVLTGGPTGAGHPGVRAARAVETALVVDANLGAVLIADQPNRRVPPASLAKMMTAYLVFEDLRAGRLRLSDSATASATAAATDPVTVGLAVGETVPVDDALKALLGLSANDVAVMLAEHLAGSETAFAARMTETAARLGMTRTRFATASGLPAPLDDQHTTARDMVILSLALMRDFPGFYHRYFALESFSYKGRTLHGHNALLSRYPGADGLKTGFSCSSGYTLAASAVGRQGRRLVGVILGSPSGAARDARMIRLLDRGFTLTATEKTPFLDSLAPTARDPLRPVADNHRTTPVCAGGVPGYAVVLAVTRSAGQAGALAEQASRRYGGDPFVMPKTGSGVLRWQAYVGGLSGGVARQICAGRRAAGHWCLVRAPAMVQADFQAAARLWRAR